MDALNPFKLAAFWTGMTLGIPMLAQEFAAEVWGTRPKPALAPAEKATSGMTRRVEDIQTRTSVEGLADVRSAFAGDWSQVSDRSFREAIPRTVQLAEWAAQDPIVLTPGRIEELPLGCIYLASEDLPPPSSSIEAETALPAWDPATKPRKRKS